jgi:hypothetical protein
MCPPPAAQKEASEPSAPAVDPETKPAPKPNAEAGADASPPKTTPPKPAATASNADQASAAEASRGEESRKPLVPVLPPSVSKDAIGSSESAESIRRLPPVDYRGTGSEGSDTARLIAGSNSSYPSTSTP